MDVIAGRFSLTGGQHDVAKEAAFGLTTDEIAKVLGISRHTVKAHLEAVYESTGCANRHELYRLIYDVIA